MQIKVELKKIILNNFFIALKNFLNLKNYKKKFKQIKIKIQKEIFFFKLKLLNTVTLISLIKTK